MGKLIYSMNVSLDGFVETVDHRVDWGVADGEMHAWWTERIREADAFVYGRRLYETMSAYWPTAEHDPAATPEMLEFARVWNPKPKFVFSTTLQAVDGNSRLVSGDVGEVLARLRTEFDGVLDVGGATLAAEFIRRDLVDVFRLVVHPVVLGGGVPFFPELDRTIPLRLVESHTFATGVAYRGYARR